MKKLLAALLCVFFICSLAGCLKDTSEPPANELSLTLENYPVIDGSTANLPLAYALAQHFLGMTLDEAESFVNFNTTDFAYMNLADGACDLVLAYEASVTTIQWIEENEYYDSEFDYYPIGRDALVFIVSQLNPVESLTAQQVADIYAGDITNWKEVGGEDKEIVAFQRPEMSGSQTMLKKLVMNGRPLMDAPTELVESEMGGLIEALDRYSNEANAIGYSVYYYANFMYAKPNLRFLSIDGVAPTNETIKSSEYPYINEFYAVVRKSEPADSPARQLAEWLSTADGKALMEQTGYVTT